jgi:hypothetical protein
VRDGEGVAMQILLGFDVDAEKVRDSVVTTIGGGRGSYPRTLPHLPRRPRLWAPLPLVVVTWALGAVTLGAGILIGWAIWG